MDSFMAANKNVYKSIELIHEENEKTAKASLL
jgi:hypothetical protein